MFGDSVTTSISIIRFILFVYVGTFVDIMSNEFVLELWLCLLFEWMRMKYRPICSGCFEICSFEFYNLYNIF